MLIKIKKICYKNSYCIFFILLQTVTKLKALILLAKIPFLLNFFVTVFFETVTAESLDIISYS